MRCTHLLAAFCDPFRGIVSPFEERVGTVS